MGVEFPHGLWKTVLIHDMRDNIHIHRKKREVGCIPSTCKLRNAWWSGRFIWFHQEPAWTGTFLSTQNALWMCEAWDPVCVLWCNISSINQMNTRCNRSFTEPFQTQLPLRWHLDISSHPFSANIKWFAPHFRILSFTKKKKKSTLLSFLSEPKRFAFNEKKS